MPPVRALRALAGRVVRRAGRDLGRAAAAAGWKDRHEVEISPGPPRLVGYVYRPRGAGPFPAILYNHGSEPDPDRPPGVAAFFNAHGYVLFAPHRRGRPPSGGTHESVLLQRLPAAERGRAVVRELESQVDDILAGLAWLRRRPYVDPQRIVVAGHSFGAIEALLVAERTTDLCAAFGLGAGIAGWDTNPLLRQRMLDAAARATIPVLILQAENDFARSAPALGEALGRAGNRGGARVYPPFGTTTKEGHGGFTLRGSGVWGDDVLAFLRVATAPAAAPAAARSA
jgi:dienelactone hydrolase